MTPGGCQPQRANAGRLALAWPGHASEVIMVTSGVATVQRFPAIEEEAPSKQETAQGTTNAVGVETCAALDKLDAAAKGRASIVRSCSEAKGLPDDERESLKDLLRCITEQRKRLRALRRLWQSLDASERPSADLVETTALCVRESSEIAAALAPWRLHTIERVSESVSVTWTRLARTASRFSDPAEA
jgi:hypothetical protein